MEMGLSWIDLFIYGDLDLIAFDNIGGFCLFNLVPL